MGSGFVFSMCHYADSTIPPELSLPIAVLFCPPPAVLNPCVNLRAPKGVISLPALRRLLLSPCCTLCQRLICSSLEPDVTIVTHWRRRLGLHHVLHNPKSLISLCSWTVCLKSSPEVSLFNTAVLFALKSFVPSGHRQCCNETNGLDTVDVCLL